LDLLVQDTNAHEEQSQSFHGVEYLAEAEDEFI